MRGVTAIGTAILSVLPFAGESNRQTSLAGMVNPPAAAKKNDNQCHITSRKDFISFDFNMNRNKYELKPAKKEDIEKYLKKQGVDQRKIELELFFLNFISDAMNQTISKFDHITIQLKDENNKPIPDSRKIIRRSPPILERCSILLVESIPHKFPPGDFALSTDDVDIKSVAIRQLGKEKVISFNYTTPEDFEKPDGRRIGQAAVVPIGTRLIIIKGDNAYIYPGK